MSYSTMGSYCGTWNMACSEPETFVCTGAEDLRSFVRDVHTDVYNDVPSCCKRAGVVPLQDERHLFNSHLKFNSSLPPGGCLEE